MKAMTLELTIFGIGLVVWLLICMGIYRWSSNAAWLAGATVAYCLFFLGATVGASFFVKRAFLLAPLWVGILFLSLLHLSAARHESDRIGLYPKSSTSPAVGEASETVRDVVSETYSLDEYI